MDARAKAFAEVLKTNPLAQLHTLFRLQHLAPDGRLTPIAPLRPDHRVRLSQTHSSRSASEKAHHTEFCSSLSECLRLGIQAATPIFRSTPTEQLTHEYVDPP
jgi:hypothetical protein